MYSWRALITLATAVSSSMLLSAQQSTTQQAQPEQKSSVVSSAAQPAVASSIRKTVVFLTVVYRSGNAFAAVAGTGFFVAVPDKRLGETTSFGYLVTNRHVAQPGVDLRDPHEALQVRVRLNLKVPQGEIYSVDEPIMFQGPLHWYFPQDDSVDLAVLPVFPSPEKYDFLTIPTSVFATDDQIKSGIVDVGDPVLFTGFFSSFPGQKQIEPIVRQGIIAMMPDEVIGTTLHKPGHLFLADAHAFHGNSGSPIFVSIGGVRRGSLTLGEQYLLIGVISGYFPESAGYTVPAATVLTAEVHDNSGISAIVPVNELMKLLNSPELQALRDDEVRKTQKKP